MYFKFLHLIKKKRKEKSLLTRKKGTFANIHLQNFEQTMYASTTVELLFWGWCEILESVAEAKIRSGNFSKNHDPFTLKFERKKHGL